MIDTLPSVSLVVNLRLSPSRLILREDETHLTEAEKVALNTLTAAVGPECVDHLAAQVPDVLNARVDTFIQYETVLLGQVQTQ